MNITFQLCGHNVKWMLLTFFIIQFSVAKTTLESQMSVCPSQKPLSPTELLLSTIEPTDHLAYRPSSLSTIKPINHQAYQPSSLSTIKPVDHLAYCPFSLSTIKPIDHWDYGPSSLLTIKPIDHQAFWPLVFFRNFSAFWLVFKLFPTQ